MKKIVFFFMLIFLFASTTSNAFGLKILSGAVKYATKGAKGVKTVEVISKFNLSSTKYVDDLVKSQGFKTTNLSVENMTNYELKHALDKADPGHWVKVYREVSKKGEKTEIHYFWNKKNNNVYDVKFKD